MGAQTFIMLVQKSSFTAYFWLLTAGWLGGHHFYLRDPMLGRLSILLCWTGLPLLAALLELPTLHRRVRRVNRLLSTDYHGRVDGWDLPAPSCARCHRNIAWIIKQSQGLSISRNHQLLRLTAFWWRQAGLLHPTFHNPHAEDVICPSCRGEIPPVISQPVPEPRPAGQRSSSPALSWFMIVVGGWMVIHGGGRGMMHQVELYARWQTTPGVVTYNAVDMLTHHTPRWLTSSVSYQPQVQFRYVWEGERWSMGGYLAQSPPSFATRAKAESYLKQYYSIGQVIEARVNPEDPEQAYAMVRPDYDPLWMVGGLLIMALPGWLRRSSHRLKKKQAANQRHHQQ
ncbi:DUF3592 domain-containing protein [Magnetococcus sp. PR-3]|uniref:DUF3592 domain-containing protein n=1 Tax=Magnetococcus sp. PR-3 TaxID=3120355 RepID=UPI002FCE662C